MTAGSWGFDVLALAPIRATPKEQKDVADGKARAAADLKARRQKVEEQQAKSKAALHVQPLQASLAELRKQAAEAEAEATAAQKESRKTVDNGAPSAKLHRAAVAAKEAADALKEELKALPEERQLAAVHAEEALGKALVADGFELLELSSRERDAALK
jgi:hypothetical protein